MGVGEDHLVGITRPAEVCHHLVDRLDRWAGRIPGTHHAGEGVAGGLASRRRPGPSPPFGLLGASGPIPGGRATTAANAPLGGGRADMGRDPVARSLQGASRRATQPNCPFERREGHERAPLGVGAVR